jgi:hypothetical protein
MITNEERCYELGGSVGQSPGERAIEYSKQGDSREAEAARSKEGDFLLRPSESNTVLPTKYAAFV